MIVVALLLACGEPPADPADVREVRLQVDGMACDSCAERIEKTLERATGVQDATVDFGTSSAVVRFDGSRTDEAALERVVDDLGFDASMAR
jgi:Cu+-exporting ATPase